MKYSFIDGSTVIHADATTSIDLHATRRRIYGNFGKRLFDILLSLALLPILLPIIAILWVLTARDGGPGTFGHTRVGKNGKAFKCWKLRTMVVDADQTLKDHLKSDPEAAAEWAKDFKLKNDPRITPIGRVLRKTSLDELPQIFNVLRGDMSFVGPRPIVSEELERYGKGAQNYLSLKPGITGMWQIYGRNDISYDERVQLDVDYFKKMSLSLDLKLVLMTPLAALKGSGY